MAGASDSIDLGSNSKFADVDISVLGYAELHQYSRELITALHNPGIEFEAYGKEGEADREKYRARLELVKAELKKYDV